jgi:prepilin-type processing-associated H-X9-DG protein
MADAVASSNYTLFQQSCAGTVPAYICPADPNGGRTPGVGNVAGGANEGFATNYLGCAGNNLFSSPATDGTGCNGILFPQSKVKLVGITDGTSNQVMATETLLSPIGAGDDRRGRIWNAWQGECLFSTLAAPNNLTAVDNCYSCPGTANPKNPCTAIGGGNGAVQYARGLHNGGSGVNCAFADGTVRFIPNNVNLTTWQFLGSKDDNNPVDISAF